MVRESKLLHSTQVLFQKKLAKVQCTLVAVVETKQPPEKNKQFQNIKINKKGKKETERERPHTAPSSTLTPTHFLPHRTDGTFVSHFSLSLSLSEFLLASGNGEIHEEEQNRRRSNIFAGSISFFSFFFARCPYSS